MAAALKDFFSPALVRRIAASLPPSFPAEAFVRDATKGLASRELVARGEHIAAALKKHLPQRYEDAVAVLLASLGPEHVGEELEGVGMGPFFYLPHVIFVAEHGLEHFALSMRAQHELTRRFTCEFSIRPYIDRYPEQTLAVLAEWAHDPSPYVRRLVSEGTRPRLPWAKHVRFLEEHPERALPLLELLKDDPASVVRRSVANHLNDLSKFRPELVHDVARRWLPERRPLIEHALRSAIKRGDRVAMKLLGFGARPKIAIEAIALPRRVAIGGRARISFDVRALRAQSLIVDLVVNFVKANGKPSPKVFKVAQLVLARGERATASKSISLAVHTTRKPYPGRHTVEAVINGERQILGGFVVTAPQANPKREKGPK